MISAKTRRRTTRSRVCPAASSEATPSRAASRRSAPRSTQVHEPRGGDRDQERHRRRGARGPRDRRVHEDGRHGRGR